MKERLGKIFLLSASSHTLSLLLSRLKTLNLPMTAGNMCFAAHYQAYLMSRSVLNPRSSVSFLQLMLQSLWDSLDHPSSAGKKEYETGTVYAISRQPKWYNNGLRMQENSLESTEIFKIFRGSIPPYPPSVSRLRRSLFLSKHLRSPNPLQ